MDKKSKNAEYTPLYTLTIFVFLCILWNEIPLFLYMGEFSNALVFETINIIFLISANIYLHKRHNLNYAALLAFIPTVLNISFISLNSGGIFSPIYDVFLVLILGASIFFAKRGVLIIGTYCLLLSFILFTHYILSYRLESTQMFFIIQRSLWTITSQISVIALLLIYFREKDVRAKKVAEKDKKIQELEGNIIQSAKMAALGTMAAGMAHEINNPLTVILGQVYAIEDHLKRNDFAKQELAAESKKIKDATERITKITRSLKSLSRKSDQDPKVPTSVRKIIDDNVSLCGYQLKNYRIELRVGNIADGNIPCRESEISQVLLNLVGNAVDAIKNLPERWIAIETSNQKKGLMQIIITDSGSGIPQEIADSMMTSFFTTKGKGEGTGLGLSISKSIIENHGGNLILDKTSHNTKFIIELPVK